MTMAGERGVKVWFAGLLAAGLLAAAPAQAALVSYYLDQSNALPDDINYLQVTVAENGDDIDFTISMLGPLMDAGKKRFGIQKFAFNIRAGLEVEDLDLALPAGWRARNDGGRMDGFGRFDMKLVGRAWSRTDELTFSITGIDGDTPEDYVLLPIGRAPQGDAFFAAMVSGFSFNGPMYMLSGFQDDCGGIGRLTNGSVNGNGYVKKCKGPKERGGGGGFFGGVTRVPAPPTVWLLLTGIAGLAWRRLQRETTA